MIPLHLASAGGYVDVVELLLSKSMQQINFEDARKRLCIHYAAINSHVNIVTLLLGLGAEIDCVDDVYLNFIKILKIYKVIVQIS